MKTDYLIFRKNVQKVRAAKGISAKELSEIAKLKHGKRIHDIEDGRARPTLDEVCAICKVVGYSIDQMLYEEAQIKIEFRANN